ncbi:hypothetical protein P6144_00320 [Sphingomonas sp. HITSZ_GF]|uniref:hypothetical protein n=1 Tax=Sphingomonas sp. HITSZ_GF TaxID=3037247 RepID=UPI00240D0700|nr:hypothetical protein [Sphingomonas sp. HITSZ_GF]MDG2532080.1 hypothetical protein [Sphingomonas sp. HITSZ_GF]
MAQGLQLFDTNGFMFLDTDSSVACVLGSVVVGGSDQTQSGSFTDLKLSLGRPFAVVTSVEVNSFIGYKVNVSISGTTVSWSFPANTGSNPYPRCRFIYGLR